MQFYLQKEGKKEFYQLIITKSNQIEKNIIYGYNITGWRGVFTE